MSISNSTQQVIPFSVAAIQSLPLTTDPQWEVGNYAWVSVQITAQYTGTAPTITFQTSDDGVNWQNTALNNSANIAGAWVLNSTTAGIFSGPIQAKFFRLNFTGAYSSGTATGTVAFFTQMRGSATYQLAAGQQGTWNVGVLASATGGYSNSPISTATTTLVKTGAATIHTVNVLGGTLGAITVYDSLTASGTVIMPTFTPTVAGSFLLDVACTTGITVVTAAATAVQVSFK